MEFYRLAFAAFLTDSNDTTNPEPERYDLDGGAENGRLEGQDEVLLDHGEQACYLLVLAIAIHNGFRNQSVELCL
jgi:hypothetical protein